MRKFFAFAALTLLLVACSPTTEGGGGFNPTVPAVGSVTTVDEKAMIGLELTAIALNEAASKAVDAGILQPGSPRAIQVADLLVEVRNGVLLARQAYDAGDGPTASARAFAALGLIGQVQALIAR